MRLDQNFTKSAKVDHYKIYIPRLSYFRFCLAGFEEQASGKLRVVVRAERCDG